MTTRRGHTWLVVHLPGGAVVARNDSPLARQARKLELFVSKYRTIEAALAERKKRR